ncbi:MAG TPA: SDR family oxidoreductase [Nocardioides sp.]|nr:SDR family oxidoreductase [Nocardioides sp.]
MDLQLRDRTVLVPGATGGLGLACARLFAAEGARVVLAGRREDVARDEAARLPAATGVGVDLAEPGGADALVDAAEDAFGPVDVLVLNGGGPPPGLAADVTEEQMQAALDSLLLAQQRLVRRVLPGMRERGWGRIVAIGSSGVQQPLPRLALSNAARGALAGWLKTLAAEVAGDGVTVNMVLPGRIDTDRVAALDAAAGERTGRDAAAVRAESEGGIPAGRYGTPEEFASAVVYLAGGPAGYVTGVQLRCDGGLVRSF